VIFHLLGFPGVGKYTVAREMSALAESVGTRIVVVDNHLTSNPVLAVIDADGVGELPDGVWDRVRAIREVVNQTIEDLSPPDWSFVFTNVIVATDPDGQEVMARLQRLADARSTNYVPVMLHCDISELRRRVTSPGRHERHKWVDPDAVEAFARRERLLGPQAALLDVDVTAMTATESAASILRQAGLIES